LRFGTHGSLAVDLGKGVFYDHEADEGGGVLDLIKREKGLEGKAAFDFLRSIGCDVEEPRRSNGTGKLVEIFSYIDADGALAFEVLRYHPKKFWQRRRTNGGYEWRVKGVPALPYRLPQLIEAVASRQIVFIVEGERKVNALAKWNVIATCNAGGAKKWK